MVETRQTLQQTWHKFLGLLSRVWKTLDGWKATIGLLTLYIEDKYELPDVWYVDLGIIAIYIWTGVGIAHKVKKQLGKTNGTEVNVEEIQRHISRFRKLNDKL